MKNYLSIQFIKYALIAIVLLVHSCQDKTLTPQAYINGVKDPHNGMRVLVVSGGVNLELQYKPPAYIAIMEQTQKDFSAERHYELIQQLGNLRYFDLKITPGEHLITPDNTGNGLNHDLDYLIGGLQNDLYLITGNDTISCGMYHYEASAGIGGFYTFLLAFDAEEKEIKGGMTLVYEDKYFGCGEVNFYFSEYDLSRLQTFKPK